MLDRVFSHARIRPALTARRGRATLNPLPRTPRLDQVTALLTLHPLHARSLIRTNPSAVAFIHRLSGRCEQVPHRKEER